MTHAALLAHVRQVLDDESKPYLWSDAELIGYYNDVMAEIAQQTDSFIDPATTAVVDIAISAAAVTAGTMEYALSSLILEIHSAKIEDETVFLTKTTAQRMNDRIPAWRDATAATPQYYLLDYLTGYITLYPPPVAAGTINLTVTKLPAVITTAALTGSPELNSIYHQKLRHGIAKYAFLKSGEETYNEKKAAIHTILFKGLINEIKLAFLRMQRRRKVASPHPGNI